MKINYQKKLGQNFLINKKALRRIVEILDIQNDELILEIGAGSGNLTEELRKKTKKIIALEKDPFLVKILKEKFPDLRILKADVRKILPSLTSKLKNYKIVGNIPYYLTGYLLRIFQKFKNPPRLIVLTLQKEVALKLVAQPPRANLLAMITQLWAEPKIIFYLKPKDFWPRPRVFSAVICLKVRERRLEKEEKVIQLLKKGFAQPRKTLFNNLSRFFPREIIEKSFVHLGISKKIRAQELSLNLWITLMEELL